MNTTLKVGVIAREPSPTIEEDLAQEARSRGHVFDSISMKTADVTKAEEEFNVRKLLDYDVLYYRTSLGFMWAQALQRYVESNGKHVVNMTHLAHPFLERKTYQAYVAGTHGILTPKTLLDTTDNFEVITEKLGVPFVAKADVSAQGRDVHLVSSVEEFAPVAAQRREKEYFYQEYIPHEYDCRVHLVCGKPVTSYTRIPAEGEFRSNVALGGTMEALTEEEKKVLYPLAEKVADAFGLDLHVVDFLKHAETGEFVFVEINSNPGWDKWNDEATGVDMNVLVMDYLEEVAAETRE
jgi:RimK family alpha-L-glutamate ligase